MSLAKSIALVASEIEALGNMYPNMWPASKIIPRRPGKWQFRVPVAEVSAACALRSFAGGVAVFEDPRMPGQPIRRGTPVEVGDILFIDEACQVTDAGKTVVHFVRLADGNVRTVRSEALARLFPMARKSHGQMAPRPIPEQMAREERIRVMGISPQKISAMSMPDYEAEGAVMSNVAGRGRYLPDATRATGFQWGIRAEKFPSLAGLDAWAWAIVGARVIP